jgi:hypothetical protein
MDDQFRVPPAVTAVIALGAAVIGGLMAHATAQEGIELFEDKTNDVIDKVKNRKNKKTPPPSAE